MVQEQIKSTTSKPEIPANWAKNTGVFSGDELIDAYFLGKEAGIQAGWDEKFRTLATQFSRNVDLAIKLSEQLYQEALHMNICLKGIHLKADSPGKFKSVFVTDINDHLSEKFLKVLSIARKYKAINEKGDLYISFLFMPYSKKISKEALTADGYFLEYDEDK
ncbi:MAG: hypothetical protein Q8918_09570 [Bacteroidota bacterium]|nr:hypothetical protein [Bacteroidota bacterium]